MTGVFFIAVGIVVLLIALIILVYLYEASEKILEFTHIDRPPVWVIILAMIFIVALVIFIPYLFAELLYRIEVPILP
jgi:hypothetical protein